jgi:hypothetical protein
VVEAVGWILADGEEVLFFDEGFLGKCRGEGEQKEEEQRSHGLERVVVLNARKKFEWRR